MIDESINKQSFVIGAVMNQWENIKTENNSHLHLVERTTAENWKKMRNNVSRRLTRIAEEFKENGKIKEEDQNFLVDLWDKMRTTERMGSGSDGKLLIMSRDIPDSLNMYATYEQNMRIVNKARESLRESLLSNREDRIIDGIRKTIEIVQRSPHTEYSALYCKTKLDESNVTSEERYAYFYIITYLEEAEKKLHKENLADALKSINHNESEIARERAESNRRIQDAIDADRLEKEKRALEEREKEAEIERKRKLELERLAEEGRKARDKFQNDFVKQMEEVLDDIRRTKHQ